MKFVDPAHSDDRNALVPEHLLLQIGQPDNIPVERGIEPKCPLAGSLARVVLAAVTVSSGRGKGHQKSPGRHHFPKARRSGMT